VRASGREDELSGCEEEFGGLPGEVRRLALIPWRYPRDNYFWVIRRKNER
jgi:hypothetical protein